MPNAEEIKQAIGLGLLATNLIADFINNFNLAHPEDPVTIGNIDAKLKAIQEENDALAARVDAT